MHRFPKIVIFHKKSRNSNKMVGRRVGGSPATPKPKPRLERLIASKNIDYELPSTSSLYFEDSSESTSLASSASPGLRTRSLDASPLAVTEQTSFRIEGTEGECEMIYRCLGFSGPEDFAIPADDWEAMKVRSPADVVVPRFSRLNYSVCSPKGCDSEAQTKSACPGVVSDVGGPKMEGFETFYSRKPSFSLTRPEMEGIDFGCSDSIAGSNVSLTSPQIVGLDFGCSNSSGGSDVSSKIDLVCSDKFVASNVIMNSNKLILGDCRNVPSDGVCELSDRLASIVVCEFSDRLGDCDRANDVALTTNGAVDPSGVRDSHAIVNDGESGKLFGRGGIKGARPPALAPPPAMSLPVIDNGCSTWDILKSFAPENERDSWKFKDSGAVSSDDEETRQRYVEEEEEVHDVVVRSIAGVNGVLLGSGSCSFTTNSIDDDSSSTTTEPTSNNSPNGRFRCIITHWEKGELLGRGSFGSVYEGIADDGFFIAVKEVSLLDQGEEARQSIFQLQQEIALLSQFEHENIVQYYGTEKDESKLYIFLELVTKGSLLNLYQKYNLRDSQVSAYTRQILHGLKYLHDRNVVHRDIKCANILVDANGSVKLADFGLAKATKLNDVKSCKGTPFWMAPEVVNRRNQGYGLAADIWSLGCTVLEMLTRRFPYSHLEPVAALFRIGKGEPPQIPETLSSDAREFILKCLQINPNARPTAAQLLDHPFVKRPLPSSCTASPYHPSRRI